MTDQSNQSDNQDNKKSAEDNSLKEKPKKLTYRQELLVNEYIKTGSATKAAENTGVIEVGKKGGQYKADKRTVAGQLASEILNRPECKSLIRSKLDQESVSSALIINKLIEDIGQDMREFNPAIRTKSLELLGKHLRMWDKDNASKIQELAEQVQAIGWLDAVDDAVDAEIVKENKDL